MAQLTRTDSSEDDDGRRSLEPESDLVGRRPRTGEYGA